METRKLRGEGWITIVNSSNCWVFFFVVGIFVGWQDIALVGEKGSGKSTLVRCLSRLRSHAQMHRAASQGQCVCNHIGLQVISTKLMCLHDSIWDNHETPQVPHETREDSQFILLPWHELKRSPSTPHVPWHEADTPYERSYVFVFIPAFKYLLSGQTLGGTPDGAILL